jgi:hypothetical protein
MLSWGDSLGPRSITVKAPTELERLAVRDGPVGKHALLRPLVAEHRAQDLLLQGVPDHGVDSSGRDHGQVVPADELNDPAVVIRMGTAS